MKQSPSMRLFIGLLVASNLALVIVLLSGGFERSRSTQHFSATMHDALAHVPVAEDAPPIDKLAAHLLSDNRDVASTAKNANAWIACSIGTAQSRNTNSVDDVLANMAGYCGWRDKLFEAVVSRLGGQHRRVGFLNVPIVVSHATTEILAGEEWLWFDSSFGRYFCLPDSPDTPLSIREVRMLWPNVHLATVARELNRGKWINDRKFDYNAVPVSSLPANLVAELEQLYILSDLVVHHPNEVYLDRITIPLWLKDWRAIGEVSQSHEDMTAYALAVDGLDEPLYTPFRHLLGPYWGTGPIIDKVFEFQSLESVTVELVLHFVGEAPRLAANIQHATLHDSPTDRAVEIDTAGTYVTITFPVHPPVSRLVVRKLGKGTSLLDAIAWNTTLLSRD